jgi:DNA-directed RNA polymerase III subunit RPC4
MGKGTEGGYISSGDEEGGDIPRKDIDAIEISDDEDANDGAGAEPTMLLPVRIERREHVERTVAINTEASSEAAAKILQQAEATGGEIKAEPDDIVPRKGKGKAKDLEITGERRPYKGMWQDEEEGDVRIKAEPLSDDEAMPDAEPVANSELIEPKVDPTKLKKEPKATTRSSKKAEPVLQTEEEKQEHARFQLFQQAVRFELGPDGEETAEPRSESTYIFQLPPIMAQAKLQDIKTEPEAKPLPQPGVKPEKKTAKTEQTKLQPKPVLPEDAAVGKIRVHESGRTTLVWGGKVYDLIASNPADAVGEIVGVEHVEESLRVVPEDMGDSSDLGRLKGKFVALPSWKAML